jgi:hypothetical protein
MYLFIITSVTESLMTALVHCVSSYKRYIDYVVLNQVVSDLVALTMTYKLSAETRQLRSRV